MEILAGTVFKASRRKNNTWRVMLLGLNQWSQEISAASAPYGYTSRCSFCCGVHWLRCISKSCMRLAGGFKLPAAKMIRQLYWNYKQHRLLSGPFVLYKATSCSMWRSPALLSGLSLQHSPFDGARHHAHPLHHCLGSVKLLIASVLHPHFQMLW